jgi:hypothetical protein
MIDYMSSNVLLGFKLRFCSFLAAFLLLAAAATCLAWALTRSFALSSLATTLIFAGAI